MPLVAYGLVMLPIVFVLGIVSWYFIEHPMIDRVLTGKRIIILLVLLNSLDWCSTIIVVHVLGGKEFNPLLSPLLEIDSYNWVFHILKLGLANTLFILIGIKFFDEAFTIFDKTIKKDGRFVGLAIALCYIFVVWSNAVSALRILLS